MCYMSLLNKVTSCTIKDEFSDEELHDFFGISIQKTRHHIDTFYYAVYINEPDDIIELQKKNSLPDYIENFLIFLREAKKQMNQYVGQSFDLGLDGMEMFPRKFANYEFCIGLNECFDIFIASTLPTAETPRIMVQLRSRYLVIEGVSEAIDMSFEYVKKILKDFCLFPTKVRENRVDYAFHTNLIQNPNKKFAHHKLQQHLKCNFKKGNTFFDIDGEKIEITSLYLGRRQSNNVFFRIYNKAQEVIEQNYKSFFITYWFECGLISKFDKYCLETAYEMRSYKTGVLVGRLKWYIENGRNPKLVEECQKLLDSCFVNSDNNVQIKNKLHNVIPEVTIICNIEFQTKRKFYLTCKDFFNSFYDDEGKLSYDVNKYDKRKTYEDHDPILSELFDILKHGRAFIEYLTGYGHTVSFVKDNKMSAAEFRKNDEPYEYWWERIRSTPIDYSSDSIIDLYRTYDQQASLTKSRRLMLGQVARAAMLQRSDTSESTFEADIADALAYMNDNDFPPLIKNPEYRDGCIEPVGYKEIQIRKGRQLRGILKKSAIKEKNNIQN